MYDGEIVGFLTMSDPVYLYFETADPILFKALKNIGGIPPVAKKGNQADHCNQLCEAIISQQLSTKVADVIWKRFVHLCPDGKDWEKGKPEPTLSPEFLLQIPDQTIRDQGISWAKVNYIKDLAQKIMNEEIDLGHLDNLSDEDVIAELTKVKGIGRWTAEMFLMFALARPDVFSTGDLGLKRAMQRLYGWDQEPDEKLLLRVSSRWSPYRTSACRILWRTLDQKSPAEARL